MIPESAPYNYPKFAMTPNKESYSVAEWELVIHMANELYPMNPKKWHEFVENELKES